MHIIVLDTARVLFDKNQKGLCEYERNNRRKAGIRLLQVYKLRY